MFYCGLGRRTEHQGGIDQPANMRTTRSRTAKGKRQGASERCSSGQESSVESDSSALDLNSSASDYSTPRSDDASQRLQGVKRKKLPQTCIAETERDGRTNAAPSARGDQRQVDKAHKLYETLLRAANLTTNAVAPSSTDRVPDSESSRAARLDASALFAAANDLGVPALSIEVAHEMLDLFDVDKKGFLSQSDLEAVLIDVRILPKRARRRTG